MKPILFWTYGMIFLFMAVLVSSSVSDPVDAAIILWAERQRTNAADHFFRMMTTVGSIKVLLPVALGTAIMAMVCKKWMDGLFIMIVFWGSRAINHLLKLLFHRERPSYHRLFSESGFSFPSGHAMNSTIFLGFLCYLAIRTFQLRSALRAWMWFVFSIVISLIAGSRVYAGVHFPTDIVAGISGGAVILSIFICLHQRVSHQ
ncbi:undecaprenyl-diphosphatase [Sporosarcina luteola]|nr:undecaprenyl-diphosphatase [Sporosarcina luteola]